jgi:XTP/dITP diphosphohydrolase
MDHREAAHAFQRFVEVVQALRTPGTGCPWDLEQNHHSLRPYLLEEAYEVLDAIAAGDDGALREELGDLLLQVVLHAQLAQDRAAFSITEVVHGITAKMVRRHPHVFGSVQVSSSAEVVRNWEQIRAAETEQKNADPSCTAALARLPSGLPALLQAQRVGEKAAKVGFDATSLHAVLAKVREAFGVFQASIGPWIDGPPVAGEAPTEATRRVDAGLQARLEHELGDILFHLCQLARRVGLSAEDSLRTCTRRFVEDIRRMEQQIPRPMQELGDEELKLAWQKGSQAERLGPE